MLRYLVSGPRNFSSYPDALAKRLNWEFFAVSEGAIFPLFSDRRIKSPRDCNFWVIPPNIQYVWQGGGACYRTAIHVAYTPSVLAEEVKRRRIIALRLSPEEMQQVKTIAQRLLGHYSEPNQFSLVVVEHAVLELTLLALKGVKARPQSTLATFKRERVDRAISWYDAHMHARPSLGQVADAVHISPSHVRKLFYDTLKVSPQKVFKKMRLQRACDILSTTSLTLEQVASQCGFFNAGDLCRVFRRTRRISPGAWRKSISTHS
jgi:AraC family transcriptional regulator